MESQNSSTAKQVLDKLVCFIKDDSSTKVKSAIVGLYSSQAQFTSTQQRAFKLNFSGQIVLLHLDYNRKFKSYFFRLYDLQKVSLLLEVELYYGFDRCFACHFSNPCLYYFQYLQKGLFAFLFKDKEESQSFARKVFEVSPKIQSLQAIRQNFKVQQIKSKQKNSLFGRFKNLFQKQQTKQKQSNIIQVKKEKAVLFNKDGEIITENISPEWRQIIKNSGLKQSERLKSSIQSICSLINQNKINSDEIK